MNFLISQNNIIKTIYKRIPKIIALGVSVLCLAIFSINIVSANTGINAQIPYSGTIIKNDGTVLDGTYRAKFIIYPNASTTVGETALYEEIRNGVQTYAGIVSPLLSINDGKFDILLGSQNTTGISSLNDDTLWLELQLDMDNNGTYEEIFSPRKRIGSALSAINSMRLVANGGVSTNNLSLDSNGNLLFRGFDNNSGFGNRNETTPSGFDRVILGNSSGQFSQVNISTLSSGGGAVGGTGWALAGNSTTDEWNGSSGTRLGTTSGRALVLTANNNDIRFFTGGNAANERMRIRNDGNIGIGTTTPNSRLQVAGNIESSGFTVIGGNYTNNAYNSVTGTRLMFGGGDGDAQSNYYIGTNYENYNGNYNKLDLRWHTGIRIGAQQQYGGVRIYDSEDLGTRLFSVGEGDANVRVTNNMAIGTTSMVSRLSVQGTGNNSGTSALNVTNSSTTSSLFVRDDGFIGMGTTTPNSRLQVAGNIESSGFTVIGGNYSNNAYNSVTGARLMFGGGDGDAQSNYYIGTNYADYNGNYNKLDLRWHTGIRIGANTQFGGVRIYDGSALGTRLFSVGEGDSNVRVTNNMGIGTTSMASRLSVQGTGNNSGTSALNVTNSSTTSSLFVRDDGFIGMGTTSPGTRLHVNGGIRYTAATTNTNTTVCRNSDGDLAGCSSLASLKDNVTDLPMGLNAVMQLRPVSFDWKSYTNAPSTVRRDLGFIAEEVAAINPLLARYNDVTGDLEGVRYSQLTSLLTSAIQEQQQLILEQSDKLSLYSTALFVRNDGNIGIGTTSPTAKLHLSAGTATANTSPLKFTSGINLTTTEAGAMEWNGTNLFLTTSGNVRQTINQGLTATDTLDFPSTNNDSFNNLTVTVTGAVDGDVVTLGIPNASVPDANSNFTAWVSAANTVTVRFNNNSGVAQDPASGSFKVFVTKF